MPLGKRLVSTHNWRGESAEVSRGLNTLGIEISRIRAVFHKAPSSGVVVGKSTVAALATKFLSALLNPPKPLELLLAKVRRESCL